MKFAATDHQRRTAGSRRSARPVARWEKDGARRVLVLENRYFRVSLWPEMGGAITSYVDAVTGCDIIWRNPWTMPPRTAILDQPIGNGSDLFDVMDGSWYVSLPTGFFGCDYFGAPIGTHGELRALPWAVERIRRAGRRLHVLLVGRSIRTPLVYRRELMMDADDATLRWNESVENRAAQSLPVAWLQHPTFGGPLIDGAKLLVPARTVRVFKADDPKSIQLVGGFSGRWPHVPERVGRKKRDCSVVPPAGSGLDHSVQLTDLERGWGCIWNEKRGRGFAMAWDHELFPYAWSWASAGRSDYPMWGEGHLITLQPSTSPVGRFADLLRNGEVMVIPGRGAVATTLTTGFVASPDEWTQPGKRSR